MRKVSPAHFGFINQGRTFPLRVVEWGFGIALIGMLLPADVVSPPLPYFGTTLFGILVTGVLLPYMLFATGFACRSGRVAAGVFTYGLAITAARVAFCPDSAIQFDPRTALLDGLTCSAFIAGASYPHLQSADVKSFLSRVGAIGCVAASVAVLLTYFGTMASNSSGPRMSNDTIYLASGMCSVGGPALMATPALWGFVGTAPLLVAGLVAGTTLARSTVVLGGLLCLQFVCMKVHRGTRWRSVRFWGIVPAVLVVLAGVGSAILVLADVREKTSALDSTGRLDELADVFNQIDTWDLAPGLGVGMGLPRLIRDREGFEVEAVSLSLHINIVLPLLKFGGGIAGCLALWYLREIGAYARAKCPDMNWRVAMYTLGPLIVIACLGGGWGPLFGFYLGIVTEQIVVSRGVSWGTHLVACAPTSELRREAPA